MDSAQKSQERKSDAVLPADTAHKLIFVVEDNNLNRQLFEEDLILWEYQSSAKFRLRLSAQLQVLPLPPQLPLAQQERDEPISCPSRQWHRPKVGKSRFVEHKIRTPLY